MAEQTKPKLASPAYILASEKHAQQLLAEEERERAKDPLNEAKRPGGFFLRGDGTPVDAEGREIKDADLSSDEKKAVADAKRQGKEASVEEQEAARERQRLAAEAAKVQAAADKKNAEATAAAIEATRARASAAAGPRAGGKRSR